MAKKIIETGGAGRAKAKKAPVKKVAKKAAAKKAASAKPVKKASAKKAAAAKPVRAKPWKATPEEIEKERKAIEARGFKTEMVYLKDHGRIPWKMIAEATGSILSYMRPDGIYVYAVLGVPDIPPERISPYGAFKRPQPKNRVKILDMKAVLR